MILLNHMGRIVGFVGVRPGVGSTSLCFELSKKLSKRDFLVCVIDFYFCMNDISTKFDDEGGVDLKDYLVGKIALDGILKQKDYNLYFIKSNVSHFDYLKYQKEIEKMIDDLSIRFDYVLIDVNAFDKRNLLCALNVVGEVFLVFDNEINTIKILSRMMNFVRQLSNIYNLNLIFNKSKIIGQLAKKYLTRNDIEEALNEDVFFEFPKFLKYNYNQDKLFDQFCRCFVDNKILHMQYSKKYKGLLGRIKRRVYAKFE